MMTNCILHFNSRPHEEVDRWTVFQTTIQKIFQLTTSRGGRLEPVIRTVWVAVNFNSRPHEEVDNLRLRNTGLLAEFQLTTSRGGRRAYFLRYAKRWEFQLTTSRGGRLHNFPLQNRQHGIISTHDLTRRSTGCKNKKPL